MDILTYDSVTEALEKLEILETDFASAKETIASLQSQLTTASNSIASLQNAIAQLTPFNMSLLDDYAKKIQTIETSTVYIDKENGKAYKIYTVNNILALEEVAMPASLVTNN